MPTATLGKWRNSHALTVPSDICNALGLVPGAKADVECDLGSCCVVYRFEKPGRRYSRSRKMTMEEFAAGWSGPKAGEEWCGSDLGAEVVE